MTILKSNRKLTQDEINVLKAAWQNLYANDQINVVVLNNDLEFKEEFKVGEYIIYVNGDRYELGRIKSLTEDGAFICYHEGETAAKTPYDLIHKLVNGFTIKETTIGGKTFKESEGE